MATWAGQASIKGTSEVMRMALLTFTSVGISFTWGVEMTYCTPYLLSLGLTKHQTAMVWVAGPLSGLIVQPVVGVISDQSTSKWGRRRPFILLCAAVVACGLVVLGFTREIVDAFVADESPARLLTIGLAVLSLYAVDFAINAVMSCARSLMVDTLPMQKQQDGAAWASRMGSLGHVIGYGAGAVDLVQMFGTSLGDTQFKKLTVVAALMIFTTASVTCWAVTERVLVSPRPEHRHHHPDERRFKVLRQIWSTLLALPPRMQAICWVVFWSWIGWFPFLIYSSTWVGETYFRFDVVAAAADANGGSPSRDDALGDMGRIGSTALTVYSTITFLSAWVLPLLVRSPDDDAFTPRPPARLAPLLELLNKRKPDLLTMWFAGQLLFAAAMALTPFVTSFRGATALVALCGVPWAITSWAPTTFLGIEVNKLTGGVGAAALPELSAPHRHRRPSADLELHSPTSPHLEAGGLLLDRDAARQSSSGELSGIYFGIMNIYTVVPQFLSNLMSILVFAALEPGKSPELATDADPAEHHSTDGPNAIAVCLFLGAISSVVAASATRKLRRIP